MLPGSARAQQSVFPTNPGPAAPAQQQANDAAVENAIKNKESSVDQKDRSAAKSQYCKAYFVELNTADYKGSKLKGCVDGVLQKVSGVSGSLGSENAPCMKYTPSATRVDGGAMYQVCMNSYTATPASQVTLLGGHTKSEIKDAAKNAAQAAQAAANSGTKEDQVDCDANESPLSWIACPLIDAGAGMTDYIFENFVQPLLENVPISSNKDDGAFVAWQTFRIFGNAILVGALLVMVFAQNIGRFVDAYTIKKMAPRIVVGAIAINISFYLCLAAIDITNIIGSGMSQILTAPFIDQNSFNGIQIDATASNNTVTGVLGGGLLAGAAAMIFTSSTVVVAVGIISMMMPLIVSIGLISLAVLFTVVIRQALIIFLTAISAVAIACFILPGTEKYFRKWMDLFVKTLMVYPIIAVIFAMSNVMGSIILKGASGGAAGTAQIITAILVVYAPLVLVPFAFKFAGGAIGAVYGAAAGVAAKGSAGFANSGFMKNRSEYFKQRARDARTQSQAQRFRNLNARADTEGARGRRAARFGASFLNGYRNDLLARESEMQGRTGKEFNEIIASGDDTQIRAYSANLRQADRDRANGVGEGQSWRTNSQGQLEVQSAAGKWVSRQAAVQARQAYGENNTAAYQASVAYEMRKATTQKEHDSLINNFATGTAERGMTAEQANGVWIGAAFANQNEDRQWKYHSWQRDENGGLSHQVNGVGLMREIDEKQGTYAAQMQNADTWTTMTQEVGRAHQTIGDLEQQEAAGRPLSQADQQRMQDARETVVRSARIAEGLDSGSYTRTDEDGNVVPMGGGVGAGAPGRVAEEMQAFVEVARAGGDIQGYDPDHYGTDVRTDSEHQATDDRTRPNDRGGP